MSQFRFIVVMVLGGLALGAGLPLLAIMGAGALAIPISFAVGWIVWSMIRSGDGSRVDRYDDDHFQLDHRPGEIADLDDLPSGSRKVCPRCGTPPSEGTWCSACGLNLQQQGELPTADAYSARVREERWLADQELQRQAQREAREREAGAARNQRWAEGEQRKAADREQAAAAKQQRREDKRSEGRRSRHALLAVLAAGLLLVLGAGAVAYVLLSGDEPSERADREPPIASPETPRLSTEDLIAQQGREYEELASSPSALPGQGWDVVMASEADENRLIQALQHLDGYCSVTPSGDAADERQAREAVALIDEANRRGGLKLSGYSTWGRFLGRASRTMLPCFPDGPAKEVPKEVPGLEVPPGLEAPPGGGDPGESICGGGESQEEKREAAIRQGLPEDLCGAPE